MASNVTRNPSLLRRQLTIDRDVTTTTAGTYKAVEIDFDKIGASSSDNNLYGLNIDIDNTTATGGSNIMYGIYSSPTLTHATTSGIAQVYGGYFKALGSSDGVTQSIGIAIEQAAAGTADTNLGLKILSAANNFDYFAIDVTTEGATTISTVDADTAAAHLTIDTDGDIFLDPTGEIDLKPTNYVNILSGGSTTIQFDNNGDINGASMKMMSILDDSDYFKIDTTTLGATTISTVDDGGTGANLTFNIDGAVDINSSTNDTIVLDAGADIILDADGDQVSMKFGTATGQIDFSNENSGDGVIRQMVDAKDLVIQQYDGTEVARFTDGGNVGIGEAAPAANLEIKGNLNSALTGTVTVVQNDATVEGSSTDFANGEIQAGDSIKILSEVFTVASITDEDTLELDSNYAGSNASGLTAYTDSDLFGVRNGDDVGKFAIDNSGALKLSYDGSNYTAITVVDDGHLELATTGTDADITLDSAGDIFLDPGNRYIYLRESGTSQAYFDFNGGGSYNELKIGGHDSIGNYCAIKVEADGVTTIYTLDSDGAVGHLNIEPDGHVEFDNCAVGFDKLAGIFSTSQVIGDGNDSTDIDFRLSNKYELELTNNISGSFEFINLIFPAVSGNFLLVISQDDTGSRTIGSAAWVAYQSDGATEATNAAFADGTDGAIRWAGGSAPTLTTTADKADIVSIYWDADNQTAFAVASLNF